MSTSTSTATRTATTPVTQTGDHRLVGWGNYPTLHHGILTRVFGYMVQVATPVVKEYHGDLFTDADYLRREFDAAFTPEVEGDPMPKTHHSFLYCVRHSGTNMGSGARLMYESLAYDAALYNFEVRVDERGEWHLRIDLIDVRPTRP